MYFSIVFLQNCAVHRLKVLFLPVNLEAPGNRIHEAFVSFKNFQRTSDSLAAQKSGMQSTGSHEWVCDAFPIGEFPGSCDAKCVQGCTADGDGVSGFGGAKPQRFGYARGYSVSSLSYMVKAFVSYRRNLA